MSRADAGTRLTAQAAFEACTARIEQHEARVRAWVWLDLAAARQQAQALDRRLGLGAAGGTSAAGDAGVAGGAVVAGGGGISADAPVLWGKTVGLKDIIDTADMPTENGTVLHAGRRPSKDAELVTQLRQAGAVVLGKTVTTELATYAPGVTTNPWDARHTPGGSSSGSAAAVACGMVDLAIGSQTNGSTIRPASFCGVVGFKPGRDRISRRGMLVQSPTFDTVGLFARDVADVQRLYQALAQPVGSNAPSPAAPLSAPRLMFWSTPYQDRLDPSVLNALRKAADKLGALDPDIAGSQPNPAEWIDLPRIVAEHGLIMEAEIARSFHAEFERGRDRLSASLQGQITRGRQTSEEDLHTALQRLDALRQAFDAQWPSGLDALMLPCAPGEAPEGLSMTGDPIFCTMATALDLPAISIPGLRGPKGLPVGVQLIGRRGGETQLLQIARHVEEGLCAG